MNWSWHDTLKPFCLQKWLLWSKGMFSKVIFFQQNFWIALPWHWGSPHLWMLRTWPQTTPKSVARRIRLLQWPPISVMMTFNEQFCENFAEQSSSWKSKRLKGILNKFFSKASQQKWDNFLQNWKHLPIFQCFAKNRFKVNCQCHRKPDRA